jgi:hypothetical protein
MHPLTEKQIRDSFVNATKREVAQATLPDLAALDWTRLDYLGWRDRKSPLAAYAVVEVDGSPTGILLRAGDPGASRARRQALCAWCTDLVATDDVTLYVARRAGASGRQGNSVGTLICTEFICSQNVRRRPTSAEAGTDVDRQLVVERRVAELRERSTAFVAEVLRAG